MTTNNGNLPTFPLKIDGQTYAVGLTKREYFAALAMQSLILDGYIEGNEQQVVEKSVNFADALLEALEKEEPA